MIARRRSPPPPPRIRPRWRGRASTSLIAEIRRNARYRADDFADLTVDRPVDAGDVARQFKAAIDEAERFVAAMPAGQEGRAYLVHGRVVEPRPSELSTYRTLTGRRRGHWPSSPDIAGAMIEDEGPS